MKTHANLPRAFTKTWLKELKKALAQPGFKITALPTIEAKSIHGDEWTNEEIENWKEAQRLITKAYKNQRKSNN